MDARVPMLDVEAALAAGSSAGVPAQLAELSIFRVLLRRERLAKATSDLLLSLLFGGSLDARLRELVILRIGWRTGSVYGWTQHWRVAVDLGVPEADLLAVRTEHLSATSFGDVERAVLAATDEALAGRRIGDATMAVLREHLDDDAVLELVAAIGTWSMISTVLRSLDVPLEDGVMAWPPDGAVPR
jgi:alkylhydroperoxidase family enzyme